MDVRELLLGQHARLHRGALTSAPFATRADAAFGGVTDEQMRLRPAPRLNPLAWILWHMARAEDALVHVLVAGQPQVYDERWRTRLKVEHPHIGSGMTEPEVGEFVERVDVGAVRDYRDAVGLAVRATITALPPARWAEILDERDIERTAAAGVFGPGVQGWPVFFTGRSRGLVVGNIAVAHNAEHIGEALTVRSQAPA